MATSHAKSDLLKLGKTLLENGPVKTLATSRRIRILFNNVYVADTTSALYVWEHEYYPYYYLPVESFTHGLHTCLPSNDDPQYWTAALRVGARTTDRILVFGDALSPSCKPLERTVRVEFAAADVWFEEDVPIYVHPKDPFRRVDVLHSSRALEIRVDGHVVAQTSSSYHLHETGLPCRFYVPATAVARDRLRESGTTTACPYKGVASYYHVTLKGDEGGERVYGDLVWYYKTPTLECAGIAGCLCFYHEKDGVEVRLDGNVLQRPKTRWS
ncbi:DUF427-domain-containing protein [Daldinia decipiens]|uniref:DUF427-domain-containing protein n=1 Tax=Daldinia decipiens TaxID=326647 RepID=UPI0020C3AC42|nr:DUF427-domain-containing protein [Daldinia decipiens]KAI1659532.1 DUF427-domain-containing protein [Daldinia decipiens]